MRKVFGVAAFGVAAVSLGLYATLPASDAHAQQERREARRAPTVEIGKKIERSTLQQIIQDWPEASREVVPTVTAKYGMPDEATATMLVWHDTAPWKRTVLYRDPVDHNFPKPHKDVLEQFINYEVPADQFDELARYDGSVIVERTKGEISARCDMEEANFLAVNLANDIVQGKRDVTAARRFYGQTIQALGRGETPAYATRFVFDPPKRNVGDPDVAILREAPRGAGR